MKEEPLDPKDFIIIKGARVNNLKNISLAIPRNKLVVITGLSGSGKSSLAFDTLYADGQRRYVESLSSYARQFLGRMSKPDVDSITGISPAIAIEQKVNTSNPRSTIGTSTEIYEYLKLMYARIGKTFSPLSGNLVRRDTITEVVDRLLALPEDTPVSIFAPLDLSAKKGDLAAKCTILMQQGFTRILLDGEVIRIDDVLASPPKKFREVFVLVDRISIRRDDDELPARIADSIQTAYFESHGSCMVEGAGSNPKRTVFSNRFEADGMVFEEPSENLFSFNNPFGACKTCEGFGSVIGIDEDLVIPDKRLSVYENAIACWRSEKMNEWLNELLINAYRFDFPIHKPVRELTPAQVELLWTGNNYFKGINEFFQFVESQNYKVQYRVMMSRYRGKTVCPECKAPDSGKTPPMLRWAANRSAILS